MNNTRTTNALALFIGQGLNILVTFLFVPYLSRSLEIEEYGTYGQVLMIVEFVRAIFTAGLGKVIYTFYGDNAFSNNDVYKNNTVAGFLLGSLAALALVFSSGLIADIFKNSQLISLINIFALSIPFSIVYQSINSTLIYYQKATVSAKISVASNLLRLILMFGVFQLTKSLEYFFMSMLLGYILQYFMGIIAIKKLNISDGVYQLSLLKSQISKGASFGIISILGVAFLYSSGFIISYLEGAEQYAIFRNGAFEMPFISSIYGSISVAILPDTVKLFNQSKYSEIISLKKKAISHTALVIIPVVVFILFFNKPLIILYLSEKYSASSVIFMVYSLILLVRVTSYEDIFIASGNSKFVMNTYIIALMINIILSWVLVRYMSILGAAISTVISTYFIVFYLLNETGKILNCKFFDFFDIPNISKTLAFSLIFVGVMYLIYTIYPLNIMILISFVLLFGSLFIFGTYFQLYDINILKVLNKKGLVPYSLWSKVENLYFLK